MNLIFLDIDGVRNSSAFYHRVGLIPHPWLDPEAIARLDRLCRATDAAIVLSSNWRGDDRTPGWLAERGLTAPVISKTGWAGPTGNRGGEIAVWLEEHRHLAIERFCILDDGDDMDELRPWLIQTDHATGLLDEHVERAIAMLLAPASLRGGA